MFSPPGENSRRARREREGSMVRRVAKEMSGIESCSLTAQQTSLLVLLARGRVCDDIAKELHLSKATVAYHIDRLKRLTNQPNIPALVAFGFINGILSSDSWPVVAALVNSS